MPEKPGLITAFDEYGRQIQVTRDDWRRHVLPGHLKERWSDPDALAQAIVMSLDDGFAADLKDAAKRLYKIDPNPERGACLYAVVLLEVDALRKAKSVLEDALRTHPRSAALLTNLAKVYDRDFEKQKSEATLWQALTCDPNYENALLWYAAIERERGGEAGWIAAMERVASLDGSWRALLWLARGLLVKKDLAGARALYEKVLVIAAGQPDVLMQVSGDLGRAGYIDEILSLVLPVYEPALRDIGTGFNLLQAFLEKGDWQRGEELLHKLMLFDAPPYREWLMWYSGKFSELKQQPPLPQPVDGMAFSVVRLEFPIWTSGLADPSWLFPRRDGAREIAVLAFANITPSEPGLLREDEALAGAEDEAGRLTRALPLYLADTLRFRTDARPVVFMGVVNGTGMMVSGAESRAEDIEAMTGGAEIAVTGNVALHGDEIHLELIAWKKGEARPFGRFDERGPMTELKAVYERCESALLALLQHEKIAAALPSSSTPVPPQLFHHYLSGLGQAYALALSANGNLTGLFGERSIHRWLLSLALDLPELVAPRVALLSALANGRRAGSEVYRELEKETVALFAAETRRDLFRLTPMVFRLFDRMAEFEARRNQLLRGAEDDYVRWLGEVETTFK